jgi:autotransporter-associated beta strand protein
VRRTSKKAAFWIFSAASAVAWTMMPRAAESADIKSIANGDFGSTSVWTGGAIPGAADIADVTSGFNVSIGSGETFNVTSAYAGNGSTNTSTILQTGGTLNCSSDLTVGHSENIGIFNMTGGTVNVSGVSGNMAIRVYGNIVKGAGATQFLISGSSVVNDVVEFDVGYALSAGVNIGAATMNMTGGTINLTGTSLPFGIANGNGPSNGSTGYVYMSGGTINCASPIWIAEQYTVNNTSPTGLLSITGGTFSSSNLVAIGRANTSSTSLSNGSNATMTISTGGVFTHTAGATGNDFEVGGQGVNINATLNLLSGGTLVTDHISDQATGGSQTINFNGGVLQANTSDANFIRPFTNAHAKAPTLAVGNGGAIFNVSGFNVGIALPLIHSSAANTLDGGLTVNGPGVLTLSGSNTYSGPTTIYGATLDLTGSLTSTSVVTVNNGGGIGSYNASGAASGVSAASLQFNGSSSLVVNPTGSQFLTVDGTVNVSGATVTVLPTITSVPANTPVEVLYAVGGITGTAGAIGSGSNFMPAARATLSIVNDPSGVGQDLVMTSSNSGAANLVWTGNSATNPTFWDVQTTTNWYNTGIANSDQFYQLDNVTFDDTASKALLAVPGGPRRNRFSPATSAMPIRSTISSLPTKDRFSGSSTSTLNRLPSVVASAWDSVAVDTFIRLAPDNFGSPSSSRVRVMHGHRTQR